MSVSSQMVHIYIQRGPQHCRSPFLSGNGGKNKHLILQLSSRDKDNWAKVQMKYM